MLRNVPNKKRNLPIFGRFKKGRRLDPVIARQLKDESCDYRFELVNIIFCFMI